MIKLTTRRTVRFSDDDAAFLEKESERLGIDEAGVIRMLVRNARGATQFPASVQPPVLRSDLDLS